MAFKAIVFDAYGTLYDVQSVAAATEAAYPGHGDVITQIWRLKQLEYSWLRSLMGRYADFRTVTVESLAYTLGALGLAADGAAMERLIAAYDHLEPYPEAEAALRGLGAYRLAVLSNGSPDMLAALVRNTGLDRFLEAILSVDPKRVFKPDPRAYALVEEALRVRPDEVLFVSSNGFDVAGAKSFGFRVARIERVSPAALHREVAAGPIGPGTLYKALRTQTEACGDAPDAIVTSLTELAGVADRLERASDAEERG